VQPRGVRIRATARRIVSFSVNGGPPSSELPAVEVLEGQTVTITVINDAAGVSAENVTRNGETGAVTAQPRFTG
jgi:hypothetical protein